MYRQAAIDVICEKNLEFSGSLLLYLVESELPSTKRKYHAMTVDGMCEFMEDSDNRYCHEPIIPDKPCCLFMDCELKLEEGSDGPDPMEFATSVHLLVSFKLFPKEAGRVSILNASRKGRFSVHLIWREVWFERAEEIRDWVESLAEDPEIGSAIDLNPYPRRGGKMKTLRMPFNKKQTGGFPLLPFPDQGYSKSCFLDHLLTFREGMSPDILKASMEFVQVEVPKKKARLESPKEQQVSLEMVENAMQWMRITMPLFKGLHAKTDEKTGELSVRENMFCTVAQRVHSSNHAYVSFKPNGKITVRCLSSHCMKAKLVVLPLTTMKVAISLIPHKNLLL